MVQTNVISTLGSNSQTVVEQTVRKLEVVGLQVMQSFDLQVARAAHVGCACPHHGTDQCDCQMVVLLVYGQEKLPVTLVLHGHDGQTQVALVETPNQPPAPQLVESILQALLPSAARKRKPAGIHVEGGCHAA